MIRRMGKGDLDAVAAIWLDANREAHDFIPAAYWLGHFAEVRTALARAEVWVFETEARAEISGFIGLLGHYLHLLKSGKPTGFSVSWIIAVRNIVRRQRSNRVLKFPFLYIDWDVGKQF